MADQTVGITAGSGTNIATSELTIAGVTAERQQMVVCDPSTAAGEAAVTAKGTQGAYALAVQRLHDSGRNQTNYFTATSQAGTTAEVLLSFTGFKSNATVTATATPAAVSTGKTYRITCIALTYQELSTACLGARFTFRYSSAGGTITTSSAAMCNWFVAAPTAAAGSYGSLYVNFPEGLELASGGTFGMSIIGVSAAGATGTASGYCNATITGYEY